MARIKIDREKCKGCELCVINCKKGLIKLSSSFNSFGLRVAEFKGSKECAGCGLCAIVCPDCAITVWR